MRKILKQIILFTTVIAICFVQNVFGGSMSNVPYSKIKQPEQLFEIELRMFNAQSLNDLIPSIETPTFSQAANKPNKIKTDRESGDKGLISKFPQGSAFEGISSLAKQNIDYSKKKYIFGSIKYKNEFDFRIDTIINLTIFSPNNPNLSVNNVIIRGVDTEKVYFLVYADSPVMNTTDSEAILSYKIVEARAK